MLGVTELVFEDKAVRSGPHSLDPGIFTNRSRYDDHGHIELLLFQEPSAAGAVNFGIDQSAATRSQVCRARAPRISSGVSTRWNENRREPAHDAPVLSGGGSFKRSQKRPSVFAVSANSA
jgi:hypothetical protein